MEVGTHTPVTPQFSGARSSNELPYTRDSSPIDTDESEDEAANDNAASETASEGEPDWDEHNHHIAQAAFILWMEGYSFDWTQMFELQQDLYRAMVGRYLQNLERDD